jgi:hypothetical protein
VAAGRVGPVAELGSVPSMEVAMSRENKVNPGRYTQAGRLSPDDAARERVAAAQAKPAAPAAAQSGGPAPADKPRREKPERTPGPKVIDRGR